MVALHSAFPTPATCAEIGCLKDDAPAVAAKPSADLAAAYRYHRSISHDGRPWPTCSARTAYLCAQRDVANGVARIPPAVATADRALTAAAHERGAAIAARAPAMVPQVCQQWQVDARQKPDWISPRDRLPREGERVEIAQLANSTDVSVGRWLGENWWIDRSHGGSYMMVDPLHPAYWRPIISSQKAAA